MVKARHTLKVGLRVSRDSHRSAGRQSDDCQLLDSAGTAPRRRGRTARRLIELHDRLRSRAILYFGLPSAIALGTDVVTNVRQHRTQSTPSTTGALTPSNRKRGTALGICNTVLDRDNLWSNFNPATNTLVPPPTAASTIAPWWSGLQDLARGSPWPTTSCRKR